MKTNKEIMAKATTILLAASEMQKYADKENYYTMMLNIGMIERKLDELKQLLENGVHLN